MVVRVTLQTIPAPGEQVQGPVKFSLGQIPIGRCRDDFLIGRLRFKTACQGQGHQMLRQHIQWLDRSRGGLDILRFQRLFGGLDFKDLQCMRGHAEQTRGLSRPMGRSPSALN